MIVNKQILEALGACEESTAYFVNVVGGGDVNYVCSLDDATRAMEAAEATDPVACYGWTNFARLLPLRPAYIKLAIDCTEGGYATSVDIHTGYATLAEAKSARDTAQLAVRTAERLKAADLFYISAVVVDQGNEVLTRTTTPVPGCQYAVFNINSGEHERISTFDAAQLRLAEIERAYFDPTYSVQVGRQIVSNGVVVTLDVLEGE